MQSIRHVFARSTLKIGLACGALAALSACPHHFGGPRTPRSDAATTIERIEVQQNLPFGVPVQAHFAESPEQAVGFAFTADAGGPVTLELTGDGIPVVSVFGPKPGSSWAGVERLATASERRLGASVLSTWLLEAGTYLAVVQNLRGRTGSFTVTLGCGSDECRPRCGPMGPYCPNGSQCDQASCQGMGCRHYCFPVPPVAEQSSKPEAPPTATDDPANAPPQVCGLAGSPDCGETTFCLFEPDSGCGQRGTPGVCSPRPAQCAEVFQPVCGCDGRSYDNACVAYAAGISIQQSGECIDEAALGTAAGEGAPPCVVRGCSGQLCVEEGADGFTTCEAKPEYACYRTAMCERNAAGDCGWREDEALKTCLANPPTSDADTAS